MVSDSIYSFDEVKFLESQGFAHSLYNGIPVFYNPRLTSHFIKSRNRKSKIVLHHTAGGLVGDLTTLLMSKVSVPFLISPQGRIIMLFQPWNWAWHLGKNALGGNEAQSIISIGIELSNWGFLVKSGDYLYTYKGKAYCHISDTHLYDVCQPWRVYNQEKVTYFAKYTEEQYESLSTLVHKLCQLYAIPKQLIKTPLDYTEEVVNFKGIVTHANFRKDKYDLSPNFEFKRLKL